MRVLLISTYDLGRQPFGLASPAAWLRRASHQVECVDTSRDALTDEQVQQADVVAFYLPMHTATRLAGALVARVRARNPRAKLVAYGLYAPLNQEWLRERGVAHVLGPEAEEDLVAVVESSEPSSTAAVPRLRLLTPDRTGLPLLQRYAALQMPDGTRRTVGSTEATRGCKHLCRHCPIVPVYAGTFRAVPVDVVLEDVRAQVAAGAQHITFGDPDFFNGPTHARRVVERLAAECPGVTYDVTIKVEHLLQHSALLPLLRDTGCLFVTSAAESVDDVILEKLRKGHTRADLVRAVDVCRHAGLALVPTFVPFTPWTSLSGYVDLIDVIAQLELVEAVAPIQLAIRLLVTAQSRLLDLPDLAASVEPFDAESLTWPWRHADVRVDALQVEVMRIVSTMRGASRRDVFAAIASSAYKAATLSRPVPGSDPGDAPYRGRTPVHGDSRLAPPFMTEPWYCCAEPVVDPREGV